MANKGEWSEIYALFKILGDGKIHAGDARLNKLPSPIYPVLHVLRNDIVHDFEVDSVNNVIITYGGISKTIPMTDFLIESSFLLAQMAANKGSFNIPSTKAFMGSIGVSKIKAPSANKADIELVIHDPVTSMINQLGFSIKSQLGSPSTLLNASGATNFCYKIVGGLSASQMSTINAIPDHLNRMAAIYSAGCSLKYDHMDSGQFFANLLFVASDLPEILAECLIKDSLTTGGNLSQISNAVATANPLGYPTSNFMSIYENRMKQLLVSAALGMVPSKPWNGYYTAPGGYIVVKTNGDVICYHFYNRNLLEDYLYNNTKFERGGRDKHGFGEIYPSGSDFYIKLNLQIRFLV